MNWFRKKIDFPEAGYFPMVTDIHSHILPGIDDGSPDVETSIDLIKGLMKLGLKSSIATPHIIGDMYPNTPATISNALATLNAALAERNIDFKVCAAAEYLLDGHFIELMGKAAPLLTLKGKIILTEFPFITFPHYVDQIVFDLITEGYKPILAHPERYNYVHGNYKLFDRWIEHGFELQINLLSLTGYYGKEVERAAKYLVKNNLVTYVGTDLHHQRHLDMLTSSKTQRIMFDLFQGKQWNTNF